MAPERQHMELPVKISQNISDLRLGINRKSFREDPLLQKYKLGKSLHLCKKLPNDPDFIHGRPNRARDGGVPGVMFWKSYHATPQYKKAPKDFIKLNKRSAMCGMANAKEQNYFRAANDFRVMPAMKPPYMKPILQRLPPGMTFGKKTRVCTPIGDVVQNRFQTTWLAKTRENERLAKERKQQYYKMLTYPKNTRSCALQVRQPVLEHTPMWKMQKWNKVPPHISSFRSSECRDKAFKLHQSDATGRCGIHGYGVIESMGKTNC